MLQNYQQMTLLGFILMIISFFYFYPYDKNSIQYDKNSMRFNRILLSMFKSQIAFEWFKVPSKKSIFQKFIHHIWKSWKFQFETINCDNERVENFKFCNLF